MKLQQRIDSRPEVSKIASAHVLHGHGQETEEYLTGDFVASRIRCHTARRILVKVGTRVATRASDERLAIGRLGAIAEAIQALLLDRRQVIMVTCGANTVGRQKLRYQQVLHSSPLDYSRLSKEALETPACAAAGQSGIMALWEKLFTMLGVGCAQLLVSSDDLSDPSSCANLRTCVETILEMGAVPILNENAAASASLTGEIEELFLDNDGLAASAAGHLCADLTLFLANVDGLPWASTAISQSALHASQKDASAGTATASSASAWLHSSAHSSVTSADAAPAAVPHQHPMIISTYCPQVHGNAEDITYTKGDADQPAVAHPWGPQHTRSDDSTRSLRSKVAAAWRCAENGCTAVLLSGLDPDNILKVVAGEKIGTLFCKQSALEVCMRGMHPLSGGPMDIIIDKNDEHTPWSPCSGSNSSQIVPKVQSMQDLAGEAAAASHRLRQLPASDRAAILESLAAALEAHKEEIVIANQMDLAQVRAHSVGVPEVSMQRMKLDEKRVDALVDGIRQISQQPDPIGRCLGRWEVAKDLMLEKTTVPIGVVLAIFEARPDVLPQLVALAIHSCNGLLLKGSEDVHNSIFLLHSVLCTALAPYGCSSLVAVVQAREDVDDLLEMESSVDMIVVRGSSTLVRSIQERTKTPVLGHADGVCCIYVDADVDLEEAASVCVDSKVDYPAACNSVERVVLHKSHREGGGVFRILAAFLRVGVEVLGGSEDVQQLLNVPAPPEGVVEFHDLKVIIDIVEDMDAAVDYIHEHGSGHTDAICTRDNEAAEHFLRTVDSACVFANCSTRFSDGARFGMGAEVGISTGRVHARGPVGAEGLTTTKFVLRGAGQVVKGDSGVQYLHNQLPASG